MRKTKTLFKNTGVPKAISHAKMGTIRTEKARTLQEQKRLRRDKEIYKKCLNDPYNHVGMVSHLEPDILECEVKWSLGSITMNKASEEDGIPAELVQILTKRL